MTAGTCRLPGLARAGVADSARAAGRAEPRTAQGQAHAAGLCARFTVTLSLLEQELGSVHTRVHHLASWCGPAERRVVQSLTLGWIVCAEKHLLALLPAPAILCLKFYCFLAEPPSFWRC